MSKPITGLTFKVVKPKQRRTSNKGKVITKLVYAICVKSEDEFKANLRIVSKTQRVTNLTIPFTPASHDCKDKLRVFTKKLDKNGKRVCHIRTYEQAKLAPSDSILYTPFCEDWVYSGHMVQIQGRRYFDRKEAIWHRDFCKVDLDIKEDDIKL